MNMKLLERWPSRPVEQGFSLIELLIVVGIIALLASILSSAVIRAREEAHRAPCISNLRQCGIALQLYMGDWHSEIPPRYEAARMILPKQITQCRKDTWHRQGPPLIGSYIYARGIIGWRDCTDEQVLKLRSEYTLPRVYWLVDVFHTREGVFPYPDDYDWSGPRVWPSPLIALFLDGHVGYVKPWRGENYGLDPNVNKAPPWPYYQWGWDGITQLSQPLLPGCRDFKYGAP